MKTSRPVISRASRASLTAVELIRSKSSSRKCPASLRRFAPKVFVSIRSAPALMKLTWRETTASGARKLASSGERRRGTALVSRAPIPPSATITGPSARRRRKGSLTAFTLERGVTWPGVRGHSPAVPRSRVIGEQGSSTSKGGLVKRLIAHTMRLVSASPDAAGAGRKGQGNGPPAAGGGPPPRTAEGKGGGGGGAPPPRPAPPPPR